VSAEGGVDVLVASYWESIPLYGAWRNSSPAITAHLPNGTYQYVPKKGEGFPGMHKGRVLYMRSESDASTLLGEL
jgi:heme-degrading monooxygenase HmoA